MLHEEMIYVDRYICLQEITVESPEDYAQSATWSRPYMNNANTIVIFLRGSWSAKVEGSNYVFAPGELCLIKRLESLYLMPTEYPGSFQRLSFSAHYFRVIDPEGLLCRTFDAHDFGVGNKVTSVQYDSSRLQNNLREISSREETSARRLSLVVTLAELLHDLMKRCTNDGTDTRTEEVRQIIDFLNARYQEDIDVDQLARQVFVSRTKLARLVKECTGYTIWDYILNKRILRSVQLLHNGASNQEAALAVGFKNYSTYYKAFLRILGATPTVERPTAGDDPLLPNYYDAPAAKQWVKDVYGIM